jgi:hypothetical protein
MCSKSGHSYQENSKKIKQKRRSSKTSPFDDLSVASLNLLLQDQKLKAKPREKGWNCGPFSSTNMGVK